jgi:hypothetical protein
VVGQDGQELLRTLRRQVRGLLARRAAFPPSTSRLRSFETEAAQLRTRSPAPGPDQVHALFRDYTAKRTTEGTLRVPLDAPLTGKGSVATTTR